MRRSVRFLAAAIVGLILGGIVAARAQEDPPGGVRVCTKPGAAVQAPKGGVCPKGFTLESLARTADLTPLPESYLLPVEHAASELNDDCSVVVADGAEGAAVVVPAGTYVPQFLGNQAVYASGAGAGSHALAQVILQGPPESGIGGVFTWRTGEFVGPDTWASEHPGLIELPQDMALNARSLTRTQCGEASVGGSDHVLLTPVTLAPDS